MSKAEMLVSGLANRTERERRRQIEELLKMGKARASLCTLG